MAAGLKKMCSDYITEQLRPRTREAESSIAARTRLIGL
jgi:hypothetical protein